MRGAVKWWSDGKGFGFVVANDGPNGEPMTEIFLHYREVLGEGRKNFKAGQIIEFNVRHTPKGPRATDVKVALVD